MKTLSCISLGLSLVFGCLLLALVAEFFYLFWWKKRAITNGIEDGYSNPTKESFTLCWKKPPSSLSLSSRRRPLDLQEPESQSDLDKDLWDNENPFGEEDCIDTELMRLQQLSGPPRFLFTIKEETNEDLESEDGRSRVEETPYLTPIASPSYFTPPLTPLRYSQNHQRFLSFFELASDAEFNKIRSSPPPTFKFLRDAEEKLLMRTKINEEVDRCAFKNDKFVESKVASSLVHHNGEGNASVITIVVSKNREKEKHLLQIPSSCSQVLPT